MFQYDSKLPGFARNFSSCDGARQQSQPCCLQPASQSSEHAASQSNANPDNNLNTRHYIYCIHTHAYYTQYIACHYYVVHRIWLQKVEEAVRKGQTLRVVFFPGQCGEGTVSMGELPKADLWDGIGCGGSQKCEIATLKARVLQSRNAKKIRHCMLSQRAWLCGKHTCQLIAIGKMVFAVSMSVVGVRSPLPSTGAWPCGGPRVQVRGGGRRRVPHGAVQAGR